MSYSVGIVGCGDISDAYLSSDGRFENYRITACSSQNRAHSEEKAEKYGIDVVAVDELLADPEIDIVVNLTPPDAHAEVTLRALEAGNHVYTEKAIAASVDGSERILETAAERDLLVGSAPDTFLGAALQTCRSVLDEGRIGKPIGATAIWTSSGHESWHPNPDLFYRDGGGPLLDVGPYYVTALVFLLGPASRVTGSVTRAREERTITSEPRRGETIPVDVPTHETGVVDFENGAVGNVTASFDVQASSLPSPGFEIYGTDGTLSVPDPNHFDGTISVHEGDEGWEEVSPTHDYTDGRGIGIADLASALDSDWEHRTTGALAHHVLEILAGMRTSSAEGAHVSLDSRVERPSPLPRTFPH